MARITQTSTMLGTRVLFRLTCVRPLQRQPHVSTATSVAFATHSLLLHITERSKAHGPTAKVSWQPCFLFRRAQ
jgi:hypothetical protein